jgi:hypothetical protein
MRFVSFVPDGQESFGPSTRTGGFGAWLVTRDEVDPQIFLRAGDMVEVEIFGLDCLRNTVERG